MTEVERFLGDLAARISADYQTVFLVTAGAVLLVSLLHLLAVRFTGRLRSDAGNRPGWFSRLLVVAVLGCVLLLGTSALTGLYLHGAVVHWPLFGHVAVGGAFLVALALFAVVRAAPSRFTARDGRHGRLARLGFWLVLLAGAATGATVLLMTFPVFSTIGIERMLDLHRQFGLGLFLSAIVYAHGLVLDSWARRAAAADSSGPITASES